MERKRKVRMPDGREVDSVELGFQASGEHWNEYLVDDGTVVRLKPVAVQIVRVEGEYDQHGNPVYLVQTTNVMFVSAPEKLRRTGG